MADDIQHLMLEQFRRLSDKVDRVHEELREIKTVMLASRFQVRGVEMVNDANSDTIESLKRRMERVVRRLKLADSAPPRASD